MTKVVFISGNEETVPADCLARIRQAGVQIECRHCKGEEATLEFAQGAEVVWMRGPNQGLTANVLRQLPQCRAIFRSGSGLDALPCATAKELGIGVFNTPESISESVAEHAVSLLLAAARQIPQLDTQVRQGCQWGDPTPLQWHLTGRTLALVGYGRIARRVEELLSGFRMKTLHYDPFLKDSLPLDDLLAQADFISLHCPLTDETRNLIDARRLALMKPNAILVNTSRGPVVDETALADALRNHRLGGAALDVLCDEPPSSDNPLLHLPNVIITPHIAAFSADFERNFWSCSAAKVIEICQGLANGNCRGAQ